MCAGSKYASLSLLSYLSSPSWPQAQQLLVMVEQQHLEQGLKEQCSLLEQQIKRGKAYSEWGVVCLSRRF